MSRRIHSAIEDREKGKVDERLAGYDGDTESMRDPRLPAGAGSTALAQEVYSDVGQAT